jgi:predicted RNase H-like nuclease
MAAPPLQTSSNAEIYRRLADKARQLARMVHDPAVSAQLWTIASQYDDVADDLEMGAGEIRHPELLTKRQP